MADMQTPTAQDDEIDLGALLGTLTDHRWLIILVTAAFLAVSLAYAVLATPIYQANALVQVEQQMPELPGLTAISQTLGASTSDATTEIALITSRTVIGTAVSNLKLDLTVAPHRFPLIGNYIARHYAPARPGDVAAPWFGIRSDDWGGAQLDVFQLDVPPALLGHPLTLITGSHGAYTVQDAGGNTMLQGQVGQVARGHGVTMQVQTLRANVGTRFTLRRSSTLPMILAVQGAIKAAELGTGSGIIQLTYENANPQLAVNLLNQVSAAYVRQNVERNSAQAANSLKFVKEQLPLVREKLEKATAALNAFQISAHSVDITMQTQGLLTQAVNVEASIEQLRQQQVQMQHLYTPDHPAYKALIQQIGQLQAQKDAIDKQVGNLPDTQQQLLRLTRDVQVSNDTYTNLLNQAQQLEIARAGTVGNVRVVDTAVADTQPIKPKKTMIVLGGTVLGAFLAVAFVFLRQLLNRGVEDPAEIEKLGLAVYASIPDSEQERIISSPGRNNRRDGQQHVLAISAPADFAVEALRSLRTSLHFARLESKNNVLMISGSSPEAGKTFVTGNLAVVMAQSGQRVLLIDGDLRKGTMHRVIGGSGDGGLSEVISGQIPVSAATRQVPGVDRLYFIARGKIPPNPSELLMTAKFTQLLEKLSPLFDIVIIDTPPILAVTDAAIIGHQAGTNLLVVRFGLNQAREIALAKNRFEQNGVEIKGAIFNAVERRSAGYYSYGYYDYKTAK